MSDIFVCKHCGKEMGIKQFGRHLWKSHNQKYEDYVRYNLNDFKYLGWKLCYECGGICKSTSTKCGICYTKTHAIIENQSIVCKYCNKNIHSKGIARHLKSRHSVEFLDYVKNNLNDFRKFGWCNCVICGNICVNRSNERNQPTCSRKCMSELKQTWTGKNSTRIGAVLSDETKQKISDSNTGIIKPSITGNLNPACRPEVREQISKTRIERGVAKGEKNGMYGKTHTPEAIRKIMSHRSMNKLEKIVADELDKANISYYFQFFITENGVCKSYDFKIKDKPLIIEVDGNFWHGNPTQSNHHIHVNETRENDKIKDEMAMKRGYKVVRLWESDIKNDPSIVLKHMV